MSAQIVVSVGADSLERATRFYVEGLGLPIDRAEGPFVAFATEHGKSGLALYSDDPLAIESGLVDDYRGVAFSCLVDSPEQVDEVMARAERSGGQVRRPAGRADWGGYIGYLTDPDGNSGRSSLPRRRRPRRAPVPATSARVTSSAFAGTTRGVDDDGQGRL